MRPFTASSENFVDNARDIHLVGAEVGLLSPKGLEPVSYSTRMCEPHQTRAPNSGQKETPVETGVS